MPPRVADSVRGDTPTRGECAGEWRELPQETRAAEVVADGVREAVGTARPTAHRSAERYKVQRRTVA